MTKKKSENPIKQTEKLTKTSEGYELTVDNYGGNEGQKLIQQFNKEKLKEQYKLMKNTHHANATTLAGIKKDKEVFSGTEREELEKFASMAQKMQGYQKFIQQEAQAEDLLLQQESIRKGLKDIEFHIPELKRK